ncbi:hypothetical protein D3C80_1652620 [compost metagenome]
MAAPHHLLQGAEHGLQTGNAGPQIDDLLLRQLLHLGAGPVLVPIERQQLLTLLQVEAGLPRPLDEAQLPQGAVCVAAIAVVAAHRCRDEADALVVADGLGGQPSGLGNLADVHG